MEREIELLQEELIRTESRESLIAYSRAIEIPGKPLTDDPDEEYFQPVETQVAKHQILMMQKIQEAMTKRYGRLILMCPPGSSKSTLAGVGVSWFMGNNPNVPIIIGTHSDDLAMKMGRRIRSIIKQDRFMGIFDAGIAPDNKGAQVFQVNHANGQVSEFMAAGMNAGVTGNRAGGLVIDDPIKGKEMARSSVQRDKVWDNYDQDFKTRLRPGAWVIVILTHWNQDDVAGRILPDDYKGESGTIRCKDGMEWEVLNIQAKAEREDDPLGRKIGEYLWPEWFDRQHWVQYEANDEMWSSLFQQRPAPATGKIFKPDNIQIIDALPAGVQIRWCRGWDLAGTLDGDWTVGVKMGKLPDNRFIIADVRRERMLADEKKKMMRQTAELDGHGVRISLPQDPGQAGKDQIADLTKLLGGFTVKSSPETGDKVTRAEPFASQVNAGNVLMLRAEWNHAYIEELRLFDNGTYDDQVDASSRAFAEVGLKGKSLFTV